MKSMEIDSSAWSDEQRKQAFAKLEELGYVTRPYHKDKGYNGKASITVYGNISSYCGYDRSGLVVLSDDLTPTFEELMNYTKEDVQ
jgi:hypothetical protein